MKSLALLGEVCIPHPILLEVVTCEYLVILKKSNRYLVYLKEREFGKNETSCFL